MTESDEVKVIKTMEANDPLWGEIESIVNDEALVLYDLERRGPTALVVFVQRKLSDDSNGSSQAGVTSDDCSRVCKRLVHFFSAEGSRFGLSDDPAVEVSSPGVNRSLRLPEHFLEAVGETIRIVVEDNGSEKGGTFNGRLESFKDGELVIEGSLDSPVSIPLARVKRAHVDFQFE